MPPYAGTFAKPENALKRAVRVVFRLLRRLRFPSGFLGLTFPPQRSSVVSLSTSLSHVLSHSIVTPPRVAH
eukprot:30957-Pelagococcus_subviridis.AAC.12